MLRSVFLVAFTCFIYSCKQKDNQQNTIERHITGEWKVSDFEWELLTDIPENEKRAYDDYARTQKRIFQEKAYFAFRPDHTYVMDFKGTGGDSGTWSITPDQKLAHYSSIYHIHDTIQLDKVSQNEIVLLISNNEQLARVTLQRK